MGAVVGAVGIAVEIVVVKVKQVEDVKDVEIKINPRPGDFAVVRAVVSAVVSAIVSAVVSAVIFAKRRIPPPIDPPPIEAD